MFEDETRECLNNQWNDIINEVHEILYNPFITEKERYRELEVYFFRCHTESRLRLRGVID